ncbi:hypothetical protein JXO59_10580 [candidate division KSB1 bacterium]|nr:hypothetical protein [candidate division KSB1 bacterium]
MRAHEPIRIRKMSKNDLPGIDDLLLQEESGEIDFIGSLREKIQAYLKNPAQHEYTILICVQDDNILGYACYGAIAGTEGSFRLYDLIIRADCKRPKLAALLLQTIEKKIRSLHGRLLIAEICEHTSMAAILLQNQFSLNGRIASYFSNDQDLVFMVKYFGEKVTNYE